MLHVVTETLTGQCRLHVTERRRTCEWIDCMVAIADDYPDANCIRIVLDTLSTHNPAAFYRFFSPEKAREYLDRFEFYYTPTYGSWLNMAEPVWSSLRMQCLNRRIPDAATLRPEVAAWETERNEMDVTINRQFTNEDARTKLQPLFPTIEEAGSYGNLQKYLLTSLDLVPKIDRLRPALPIDATNTSRFYYSVASTLAVLVLKHCCVSV